MTVNHALMLLFVLLISFCEESLEAGAWKEDRNPDRPVNRVLAQFAYLNSKHPSNAGVPFTFLVTQARRKREGGYVVNLGFIVYQGDEMVEKCLTTIFTPQGRSPDRRLTITKFWCRKSF
ncbi:uncharacterized protein LOC142768973 [Rhipicephalus microplus]|uniref:uncharacterized protein LOC142768973 n=1 Tax=Rhipicephalus microplus TaxID=6941 RepID=UPI003F6C3C57